VDKVDCPFCSTRMAKMDEGEIIRLLTGSVPVLEKLMGSANPKTRVKGFSCPSCGYIALFKKKGGEP